MNQEKMDEYTVALQFFSRVLQNSPDLELLRGITQEGLFDYLQDWACLRVAEGTDLPPFAAFAPRESSMELARAYGAACGDDDAQYLDLHMDHLALFSGPSPKSPPWESVWRERDKLLFGRQTEKVFNFYADWGVMIENAGHDPEDHLGLELAFALFLLQATPDDARSGSGQTPREALLSFLDGHILPWAGLCLKKASEEASSVFYREVPKLCWVMLNNLREDLAA